MRHIATLGEGRLGRVACCYCDDPELAGSGGLRIGRCRTNIVAVKTPHRGRGAREFHKLEKEISLLQKLSGQCNSICSIYSRGNCTDDDFSDTTDRFFVLEPCVGGSLHKHLSQNYGGGFPSAIAKGYIAEVLSAVQHMHAAMVVHRDIKASNCVLNHEGRVKLCDFDCARIMPDTESKAYTICGSLHQMPPEMVAGVGYNYSVDCWAIGVLLFEFLTGSPPHLCHCADSSSAWPSDHESAQPSLKSAGAFHDIDAITATKRAKSWNVPSLPRLDVRESQQLLIEDLFKRFLTLNPEQRIICRDAVAHRWFNDIDWNGIRDGKAPVVDAAFDRRLGCMELIREFDNADDLISDDQQKLFAGF